MTLTLNQLTILTCILVGAKMVFHRQAAGSLLATHLWTTLRRNLLDVLTIVPETEMNQRMMLGVDEVRKKEITAVLVAKYKY